MCPARTELLDHAIVRLVALPPQEQDRIAIEILADLCSEEEWALLAASEPYHNWLASRPENKPEKSGASLLSPVG
jgi:hypothetical protein